MTGSRTYGLPSGITPEPGEHDHTYTDQRHDPAATLARVYSLTPP
jgi:hypothetical protein